MSEEIIKRLEKIEERLDSIERRIDPYRHLSYGPYFPDSAVPMFPEEPRNLLTDLKVGYKVGKKYRIKEGWQGRGMKNEHLDKVYTLSFVEYPSVPNCSDATLVFYFNVRDNPELKEDLRFANDMTDIELVEEEK